MKGKFDMSKIDDIYNEYFSKHTVVEKVSETFLERETEETVDAPVTEEEAPEEELEEGKVRLSTLLGVTREDMIDSARFDPKVTVFDENDWDEELKPFIPEPNPNWYWAKSQLNVAAAISSNLEKPNRPILVIGDAGVGKTAMDRQMCALTKRPYIRLGGNEGIEQAILTGWNTVTEKGVEFIEGVVKWAHRVGARLSVDEIFKFPAPVVTGTFQWMLENDGKLLVADAPGSYADKLQTPGEHFRFLATDNVLGLGENQDRFASTHIQDSSTMDRFRYVVRMSYMTRKEEATMLSRATDVPASKATALATIASGVRQLYMNGAISVSLSSRGLLAMCEEMNDGLSIENAFVRILGDRFPDDSEWEAVAGVFNRTTGTELRR